MEQDNVLIMGNILLPVAYIAWAGLETGVEGKLEDLGLSATQTLQMAQGLPFIPCSNFDGPGGSMGHLLFAGISFLRGL